jgi:hypothetical protein
MDLHDLIERPAHPNQNGQRLAGLWGRRSATAQPVAPIHFSSNAVYPAITGPVTHTLKHLDTCGVDRASHVPIHLFFTGSIRDRVFACSPGIFRE